MNIRKRFPILQEKINGENLIYFDNGATTQKPKCVIDAIANCYKNDYANIHRGVYYLSSNLTNEYEKVRNKVLINKSKFILNNLIIFEKLNNR